MSHGIKELPKELWCMFDVDNGAYPSKNYVWWFETLKEARDHRIDQMAIPNCAKITRPIKYILADPIEEWP